MEGVYLRCNYEYVPQVGLDSGWHYEQIIPAKKLIKYSKEEEEKYHTKYKEIRFGTYKFKHNRTHWRHNHSRLGYRPIYTIGRSYNHDFCWRIVGCPDEETPFNKRIIESVDGVSTKYVSLNIK